MGRLLRAGADKISLNTAAVRNPELIAEGAERFGSQCIVASVDVARDGGGLESLRGGGRTATDLDGLSWIQECVRRGAGEVLLTSMDRDGVRTGYDLKLTRAVAESVSVPVIASGGAGSAEHLRDAFLEGRASAALLAGILHDGVTTISVLKKALAAWGLPVR